MKLYAINERITDTHVLSIKCHALSRANEEQPKNRFPDLRAIFHAEEIEYLLSDSVHLIHQNEEENERDEFIEFVVRTGYKDEPAVDEDGKPILNRNTALLLAAGHGYKYIIGELFKIYNRFDVNYTDEFGRSHLQVACQYGFDDIVAKFLEFGQNPNCLVDESDYPPLHYALTSGHKKVIELLLRNGVDPNLTYQYGSKPLHTICQECEYDVMELFFQVSDEMQLQVQIDALDNRGRTPLHWALFCGHKKKAALLLRRGADVNLADAYGLTPLHMIRENFLNHHKLMKMLFEISDENRQLVQVNAQDKMGNTPLHLALKHENLMMVRLLLRRGANPNLANNHGETPLHYISKCFGYYDENDIGNADDNDNEDNDDDDDDNDDEDGDDSDDYDSDGDSDDDGHSVNFMEMLFQLSDGKYHPVQVNAQDKMGNTPLHLALICSHSKVVESLLKRGADPNLTNAEGWTALHCICQRDLEDKLMEKFFKIIDEIPLTMQVDARDNQGLTPIQWAVARFFPDAVGVLLSRGADLSGFVFPALNYFDGEIETLNYVNSGLKLKLTSDALVMAERLQNGGYELVQADALEIMKFVAKLELFKKPANLDECWHDDEEFASKSKKIMMNANLSFYDLVRLRPDEAAKLLTYEDYYNFFGKDSYCALPIKHKEAFNYGLCERLPKRFFRRWVLDSFWTLIEYRLPILCCDLIIENLMNEDLYHIYLAATSHSSS
uniref:Uncharacterized protein n=1 Tax=Trichogramma kaykai TaxID=54128 RepID=A0ABD2WB56_9HYME